MGISSTKYYTSLKICTKEMLYIIDTSASILSKANMHYSISVYNQIWQSFPDFLIETITMM